MPRRATPKFVPDRSTPLPPLMHASSESRTHLINKKVYIQVFHDPEAAQYHWVNYDAEIFVITISDLMENGIEYGLTPIQHVRLEALPGGEYLFNSNFTLLFALSMNAFAKVQTFDIFVDEVLWKWTFVFPRRRYPGGDPNNYNVINVRTGECIDGETCREYRKWCRRWDYGPECDPSDSRYESEECPTEFFEEWTFPPKVSRYWTDPDSNATVDPVPRYAGPWVQFICRGYRRGGKPSCVRRQPESSIKDAICTPRGGFYTKPPRASYTRLNPHYSPYAPMGCKWTANAIVRG